MRYFCLEYVTKFNLGFVRKVYEVNYIEVFDGENCEKKAVSFKDWSGCSPSSLGEEES